MKKTILCIACVVLFGCKEEQPVNTKRIADDLKPLTQEDFSKSSSVAPTGNPPSNDRRLVKNLKPMTKEEIDATINKSAGK